MDGDEGSIVKYDEDLSCNGCCLNDRWIAFEVGDASIRGAETHGHALQHHENERTLFSST
jgi:hypothetical protein